ncbi:MAG: hypothetical protein RKR03_05655 [Candidatus Competibacter sp.]|nr:hypothetical protein [Candidatus Contendobacter sp.]MDG4557654.1 hypothetical protein [Candidatus Contendobacter sp.]MDS4019980.1 hypothetical protein [Candidatus Competibacter sp.]
MKFRLSTAALLALALLSAAGANAPANAAESHDHGAHGAASSATIGASIAPASGLKVGEPATFTLSLVAKDGKSVTLSDLSVAHTEKVHLLIVDPSLTDYHHEHPKPGSAPGTYTFAITPDKPGEYKVFADLLPVATNRQEYAATRFTVAGTPAPVEKVTNRKTTVAGYTFELKFEEEPPAAGHPHQARLTVTGPDGKPVAKLEPIMGAFAHLVGFNEDRSEIAHIHPLGQEPRTAAERGGPTLEFQTKFVTGGYQKLFAQVQIDGRPVFAPFGIEVTPAKPDKTASAAGHGQPHGHDEPVAIPATVADILVAVDRRVAAIDQAIAGGSLAKVHGEAFAARDLLAALPEKVIGLNPEEAKALDAAIGRIRQQAALLDKFGDAGDAAQTRAVLTRFKKEIAGIRQQVEGKPDRHAH